MLDINGCLHLHKATWKLTRKGENTEIRVQMVSDHRCLASFLNCRSRVSRATFAPGSTLIDFTGKWLFLLFVDGQFLYSHVSLWTLDGRGQSHKSVIMLIVLSQFMMA